MRHQLFITEPIPGVEPLQPIVRLVEASVYVRYEQGGLMFGGYEDAPRVLAEGGRLVVEFGFGQEPLLRQEAARTGWVVARVRPDLQGVPRVAVLRR